MNLSHQMMKKMMTKQPDQWMIFLLTMITRKKTNKIPIQRMLHVSSFSGASFLKNDMDYG
jgi:hypothetical protein